MKITEYQISEALDFGAYARGKKYFQQGKVIFYNIISTSRNSMHLIGKVKGSYRGSYTQNITIKNTSNSGIDLDGDCTCPVSFNCKHVAAVCFSFQAEEKNTAVNAVESWLQYITELSSAEKVHDDIQSHAFFLTYRIFENNRGSQLQIYKSKILKNGNISKGTKNSLENICFNYSLSEYMDKSDRDVVSILKNMIDRYYNSDVHFSDEVGYILLSKLLKTKRCYFRDSTSPLSLYQDSIALEFKWQSVDKTTSKLTSNLSDGQYYLVPTVPLLTIDTLNNQISPLDSDIEPLVLKKLLDAPPIPIDAQSSVYHALSRSYHQLQLPVPDNYKVTTIEQPLLPIVHIFQREQEQGFAYLLEIQFIYADYTVDYLPRRAIATVFDDNSKTDIIRSFNDEDQSITILENFGFEKTIVDDKLFMSIPQNSDTQSALQKWNDFLNIHVKSLEESGWKIEFNDNFKMTFNNESEIIVESADTNDWFSLSFDINFDGNSYPLVPLVSSILSEFDEMDELPNSLYLQVKEGNYVKISTQDIRPILNTIYELFDKQDKDNNLVISPFDAHMIDDIENNVTWKGSKEILKLSKKLKDFSGIAKVKPPQCLQLSLRDYQQQGLNWLNFLYQFKFSGILADDMGLGKTVQTLAHLSRLKQLGKLKKQCLIIVPTSLIANWKNEVAKFTPNLNILSLYGSDRFDQFAKIKDNDLILTTYALITRDVELYEKIKFMYIILDEAQKIKNPKTKMAKTICTLKSEYRLALSGTPIENHLGEMWSIFNFLMPGFLHNQSLFNSHYRTPIEKEFDSSRQQQLNKRIKPFILRRTKSDVLTELPAKTEIIKYTQFDTKQSKLYESIRVTMEKKVRDAISKKGLNRSHIHILDALLKLRQVCCDPSLLKLKAAEKVKESAKLELLLDLLDELLQEGRKILLFSQFTSMLAIIEKAIIKRKISYVKLTGSSTKRDKIIDKFTNGEADIFLISLKAGGVGLNLVEADTVIHYDPWWNPAVENQATDRAHRIGQKKAVFVYKLIIENSIEQKIIELQKKKKILQDGIYDKDGKLEEKKFDGSELMELLRN
ncbi:MAG: DEAD/DEAH box helicase [Alcanivoracaceae bacterium]|nr:DEAD/DEAH box helicase [Alcanivoracaceae bacterium]